MKLATTNYRPESATASVVCFLHAFPLNRHMWQHQIEHLRSRGVVAVDLPGWGESVCAGTPPSSFTEFASSVRDTLTALGIREAVFAGCSMGGYTMFEIWRRWPEMVQGMILCDTRPEADTDEARANRMRQIELVRREGTGCIVDFVREKLIGRTTTAENPALAAQIIEMAKKAPVQTVLATLNALAGRADSTPDLETITVPVLAIVGEEDVVTPPAVAKAMVDKIPGADLVIIPRAGHLSPLENPVAVNQAIDHFLSRLG